MADRTQAFAQWRLGIISDDNLKQVLNDLQTVEDVFRAMGQSGFIMTGICSERISAENMYEARKRDRTSVGVGERKS